MEHGYVPGTSADRFHQRYEKYMGMKEMTTKNDGERESEESEDVVQEEVLKYKEQERQYLKEEVRSKYNFVG